MPGATPPIDPSDAAEAIRAHLVCVRGGAPFLSPADSRLLAEWLAQGHSVGAVVAAIDRVAENRRKRPTRLPFTLAKVRRYLVQGGSAADVPAASPHDPASSTYILQLRQSAAGDARADALRELADDLAAAAAAAPADLERHALLLFARFHDRAWRSLPEPERGARLTRAREELGDLLELIDPEARDAAVEELARADLRRCYPLLNVQALRGALAP